MSAVKYPWLDWQAHQAYIKKQPWLQQQTWLTDLQEQAAKNFLAQGWPLRQQEAWRYTDISSLANHTFTSNEEVNVNQIELKAHYLTQTSHRLVFINGKFSAELSELTNIPAGAIIGNFATVMTQQPEYLEAFLRNNTKHVLDNLNLALLNEGVLIYLPEKTVLNDPIECVFFTDERGNNRQQLRLIYVLGDYTKATLIENYCGNASSAHFINNIVEISLGEFSNLNYYQWQNAPRASTQLSTTTIWQLASSRAEIYQFGLGGRLSRNEINVHLQDAEAECRLHGLGIIAPKQHIDQQIKIDHRLANANSYVFTKNIIAGLGKGIFAGKIGVSPQAQKTRAQLTNRNLLLAANAEINTKPDLEIYADDVQCSHGATVGQLDQQALFYLRARGVPYAQAMEMLVQAFVEEILAVIPDLALKNKLQQLVLKKLITEMIDQ